MRNSVSAALCATAAVLATATPASGAPTASVTLRAPSRIAASKHFRIEVSGRGTRQHNFLGVFFTLHARCAGTYAEAESRNHTAFLQSIFVGRTFRVRLAPIFGGTPSSGRLCAYLYPRSSASDWAYLRPEATASRKIGFT
jgi:hypothetical protein